MKKTIIFAASAALMLSASCQKSPVTESKGNGWLSLEELSLGVDETVITKADPAGDNYVITILDADENTCFTDTYANVQNKGMITLPAGEYTLVARSLSGDIPVSSWENPVYGVSETFTIAAGETTTIESDLVCTLQQCKVTVAYSDEFLETVTGECATSVEVTAGYPLSYALDADGTYDQSAGYFAVNGNTMTVVFKGNIDGKTAKMTKTFTGIEAKQWRQVKFVQKKNEQGTATFDIVIADLISDATLNEGLLAEEVIIGEDPDAPKGDGGIMMEFDYEAGCDAELTDLENMLIVPVETRDMKIRLKATVPAGVLKFTVTVSSDNEGFCNALDAAGGPFIDLINPSEASGIIFDVVPFPHGEDLLGQTSVEFNLDAAQDAITLYSGRHEFLMHIVDKDYCSKQIPVVMVVE